MYKLILLLIATFMAIHTLQAQDLVVTSTGDSINCNITKMDAVSIYFTFKEENDIHKTMMPFQMIRTYQFNYYPGTVIAEPEKVVNHDFPHWRIGLNGGVSRQTAHLALEVPYELVDYAESLQSGVNLNGDVFYYLSENIGVGVKYVGFGSPGDNLSNRILKPDQYRFNLAVRFYGPALSGRLMNETKKNAFFFNAAIGKVDYKIFIPWNSLTGNTLSSMFEVGYDVRVYKSLALGMQLSYLAGYISSFKESGSSMQLTGYRESLNRLDLSIGVKLNL